MANFQGAYKEFVAVLGNIASAAAVVGAIKVGRQPNPENLRRLGIDPQAFRKIGRS